MTGILNLAWLIIVFPALGLTFNAFFSTRFKEEIASTIAIAASGLAFLMSALVLIALMGLPPEARSVHVPLYTWAVIGTMKLDAGLLIDPLSATMLIVVTFVGTLIHIYSIGYMHGDSRYRRFFVYLNLFMASMLILVLGDSYVMMFVGWEGVGLCSYLLIGFWFEKEANNNAAKKAFIVNRVGDFGFMLGMFLIFATVGSLQYAEVFHAAENGKVVTGVATAITLLLFVGASGQIGADSAVCLAAGRDGRPHARQRPHPRRDDGHGRRVHDRAQSPAVCARAGFASSRRRRRRVDRVLCGDHRRGAV